MGLRWDYAHPSEIMDEIAQTTPSFAGVSFELLDRVGSVQWPCNEKAPLGTPIMHIDGFVRGKGKFIRTEYVATDERTGPRFPLLLTTGRILSQYNVGAQTRRTDNVVWHEEDRLEIHPHDAENRGIRDGDWVRLASRAGETTLRALITERVSPGVVYTTFHHPDTQANVITTDFSDWATNCPEYKVTAVQVAAVQRPVGLAGGIRRAGRSSRRIAVAGGGGVANALTERAMRKPASPDRRRLRARRRVGDVRRRPAWCRRRRRWRFSFAGTTHAVMMASPADLEDFALGFSLTEGIIAEPGEIEAIEVEDARRRHRYPDPAEGPGQYALPGTAPAARRPGRLRPLRHRIDRGGDALGHAVVAARLDARRRRYRPRGRRACRRCSRCTRETGAVHAAGFYVPGKGIVAGARGCRPPQCAGQARRRAGQGRHRRRDGAVVVTAGSRSRWCRRRPRSARLRHRRLGADRTCHPHRRRRRHDAGGAGARRRFRCLHPPRTADFGSRKHVA